MHVLITNDDGIEAAGFLALEAELQRAGVEVTVVAPDRERSASSHSMSLGQTLKIHPRGPGRYAVTGTPVDNVNLALNYLLRERRPDLVVAGVNRGANLGCDVNYSGTVAAAREAAMLGVPGLAVSLETFRPDPDFGPASRFAVALLGFLQAEGLPERTYLNVNVPDLPAAEIKGVRLTVQGRRRYQNVVEVMADAEGASCYRIGGTVAGGEPIPDSDILAVAAGFISVTPLRLDYTHHLSREWLLERWPGDGYKPWK